MRDISAADSRLGCTWGYAMLFVRSNMTLRRPVYYEACFLEQ